VVETSETVLRHILRHIHSTHLSEPSSSPLGNLIDAGHYTLTLDGYVPLTPGQAAVVRRHLRDPVLEQEC
jgi:hypothetical protein